MPFDFDDEDNYAAAQVVTPLVSVCGRILLADFAAPSRPHRFGGAPSLPVRPGARAHLARRDRDRPGPRNHRHRPPQQNLRHLLWGKTGDAEHVQVIFEIDGNARTVSAYNQCT